MKPSAIRELLLGQHERLRRLLAVAEGQAEKLLAGAIEPRVFGDAIYALLRGLFEHNRSEEGLLEPLLRAGDDYSAQRVSRMLEEHCAEHALLREALRGHDLGKVAEEMPELGESLRAHMDAEERTFLHVAVVRDTPR